jgi:hypothetical protein
MKNILSNLKAVRTGTYKAEVRAHASSRAETLVNVKKKILLRDHINFSKMIKLAMNHFFICSHCKSKLR